MLIHTRKELLREIEALLKPKDGYSISKIDFICPNFNEEFTTIAFKPKNLGQEIFNKISSTNVKQGHITIHSFEELNKQQIFKGEDVGHADKNKIHIIRHYNKDNDIINVLMNSIKKSLGLAKKYDDLMSMLDDIDIKNIKDAEVKLLENFKESIIKQIDNIINESDLFNDIIKDSDKARLVGIIEALDNYIKQAIKDKNNEMFKNTIKTICGVILVVVTRGSAAILLLGVSATFLSSLLEYQKIKDKKYRYIQNPIIEFLSTELAMYMRLTNTRLLSCMLIVTSTMNNGNDSKVEFIDLSGFNLNTDDTLLSCSQNLAFKGKFTYNNDKKIDINELLEQHFISTLPMIQSSAFEAKTFNIHKHQDKQKKQDIKKHLLLDTIMQETNILNHLVYIESPHFNSALLAEIFNNKNTQYPSNDITKMAKNYLFITNAPSKYNAKLTETITESITNNKIKDDINNHTKQNLAINYQNKKSSYNTKRDYSTYRIEIKKKDDEPYLLQLSPFVRVESEKVKNALENSREYKNAKNKLQEINNAYNMICGGYTPSNINLLSQKCPTEEKLDFIKNSYGLDHIESFFKSPKDMADIITNEEQIAKDYLDVIKSFSDNIVNQTLLDIFSIFYSLYMFRFYFPYFQYSCEVTTKAIPKGLLFSTQYLMLKFTCLNEAWNITLTRHRDIQDITSYLSIDKAKDIVNTLHTSFFANEVDANNMQDNTKSDFFTEIDNLMLPNADFKKTLQTIIDSQTNHVSNETQQELQDLIDLQEELYELQNIEQYKQYIQNLYAQETLQIAILKIMGAICPFLNFTHEDAIQATKHCIAIYLNALSNLKDSQTIAKTLLKEIGILSTAFVPNINVHIAINNEVAKLQKELKNNMDNMTKLRNYILEKLKSNARVEAYTQIDLRITQSQMQYFHAKSAFISDSINKIQNTKTLNVEKLKEKLIQQEKTRFGKKFIKNLHITYTGGNNHQSYKIGINQATKIVKQTQTTHMRNIIKPIKLNLATTGIDITVGIMLDYLFPTHYETYKREYDSMIHKRYTFYYDLPYAVKRDEKLHTTSQKFATKHFTYYPMRVNSKFISFDLQSMLYGTELCIGGLTHHIGLAYHLRQNRNDILQEFLLKRLLSYLIIDEKRGAKDINDVELDIDKQIQDYTWFNHKILDNKGNITDISNTLSLDNILKYQVPKESSLYRKFKDLERKGVASAIDAYNEVLAILADYKGYYFTNTRKLNAKGEMLNYKEDKNKARRFLECLNTIGQNNIRALYVGINDKENLNNPSPTPHIVGTDVGEDKNKEKRPKLIGRLATTIIIEDGLWLG